MVRFDEGTMMLRLYVVPDDLRQGRQWPLDGVNGLYHHRNGNGNVQAAVAAGSPEYSNFTAPHEHDPLAIMLCFVFLFGWYGIVLLRYQARLALSTSCEIMKECLACRAS